MERFAQLLAQGFAERGFETQIWRPEPCFARRSTNTRSGLGKWLGYLDKWIGYPLILRKRLRRLKQQGRMDRTIFHIADHSNAQYLRSLPPERSGITCHDVLAIRGARGDRESYCPASRTGKLLQAWILANLCRARKLAAVSATRLEQLKALAAETKRVPGDDPQWIVALNALNGDFAPMQAVTAEPLLQPYGLAPGTTFLLHVGSALPRKNRAMLLEMAHQAGEHYQGKICFAGAPMDAALKRRAEALQLTERTVEVIRPSHEVLVALYSQCHAMIFPSFSEGFGWPLIEAQACGAPVIASDRQPMPEVSGGAALHADPHSPAAFAAGLAELQRPGARDAISRRGLANAKRFGRSEMMQHYLALYGLD
jgi:glycosyltransferase involved in cell wall biosynthesis